MNFSKSIFFLVVYDLHGDTEKKKTLSLQWSHNFCITVFMWAEIKKAVINQVHNSRLILMKI